MVPERLSHLEPHILAWLIDEVQRTETAPRPPAIKTWCTL
jgi:hypothetical protein